MKVSQKIVLLPQQISKPTFILNINSHSDPSVNLDGSKKEKLSLLAKSLRSFPSQGTTEIVRVEFPNQRPPISVSRGAEETLISRNKLT